MQNFFDEIENPVTICDTEGIIIYMNKASEQLFDKSGGLSLTGKSLFDCHHPKSNEIIQKLINEGKPNTYYVVRGGKKKLVHQFPWRNNGKVGGLIEISIPIPPDTPIHVRD